MADIITYRSKLGGSTIAILFVVSAILYVAAFNTDNPLIGLVVLGIFWLSFLLVYFNIKYSITRYELTVSLNTLYKKNIPIDLITKIREVDTPSAAPALSLNRLEIISRTGDHITISPQNTQGFIRELKYRNPNIRVELN